MLDVRIESVISRTSQHKPYQHLTIDPWQLSPAAYSAISAHLRDVLGDSTFSTLVATPSTEIDPRGIKREEADTNAV